MPPWTEHNAGTKSGGKQPCMAPGMQLYLIICRGQFLTRRWLSTRQAGICAVITVAVTKAQSERQAAEN